MRSSAIMLAANVLGLMLVVFPLTYLLMKWLREWTYSGRHFMKGFLLTWLIATLARVFVDPHMNDLPFMPLLIVLLSSGTALALVGAPVNSAVSESRPSGDKPPPISARKVVHYLLVWLALTTITACWLLTTIITEGWQPKDGHNEADLYWRALGACALAGAAMTLVYGLVVAANRARKQRSRTVIR